MSPSPTRKRYQRALKTMEALEPRTLLSASISSYAVPGVAGAGDAYDSSGNLWIINLNGDTLDKVGLVGSVQTVTQSIPLDTSLGTPIAAVGCPNGTLAVALDAGGIEVVNPNNGTGSVTQYDVSGFLTTTNNTPTALTVTGNGAIWFVADSGVGNNDPTGVTNAICRLDPGTGNVTEILTDAINSDLGDSVAFTLTPSGADSVWVGFAGAQNTDGSIGHNHVVAASFDGSTVNIDHDYDVTTSDSVASQNNAISSIVDGGDGTVWYTLAGYNLGVAPQTAPDQIVNFNPSTSAQTPYTIPGATDAVAAGSALDIAGLTFDADNNLWFFEGNGTQLGYLNTANGAPDPANGDANFTMTDTPAPGTTQFSIAANSDGSQLSIVTLGSDAEAGYPVIQIDVPVAAVPFNFTSVTTVGAVQGADINGTMLAMFDAPTPVTGYTATITWGDNTSSVVTASPMGGNSWLIVAPSKTFATQKTYTGSITVYDGNASVGFTSLTSVITDIPLNVTSLTVSPLILGIVTAVGSFTDDPGLALSTWTATISWGDNTTSKGIIVRDPSQAGRYLVLAVHQYRTRGTYPVGLTVTTTEPLALVTNSSLTSTVTAR